MARLKLTPQEERELVLKLQACIQAELATKVFWLSSAPDRVHQYLFFRREVAGAYEYYVAQANESQAAGEGAQGKVYFAYQFIDSSIQKEQHRFVAKVSCLGPQGNDNTAKSKAIDDEVATTRYYYPSTVRCDNFIAPPSMERVSELNEYSCVLMEHIPGKNAWDTLHPSTEAAAPAGDGAAPSTSFKMCPRPQSKVEAVSGSSQVKQRSLFSRRMHMASQLFSQLTLMHHETPTTGPAIVHRDLKLQNMLQYEPSDVQAVARGKARGGKTVIPLEAASRLSIIDFGYAANIANSAIDTDLLFPTEFLYVGTPGHMAPEIFQQKHNAKSDMFSTVACVMSMLGATNPFAQIDAYITSRAAGRPADAAEAILYDVATLEQCTKIPYNTDGMFSKELGMSEVIARSAGPYIKNFLKFMQDADLAKRPDAIDAASFFRALAQWSELEELSTQDREALKIDDAQLQERRAAYLGKMIALTYVPRAGRVDRPALYQALGTYALRPDFQPQDELPVRLREVLEEKKLFDDWKAWGAKEADKLHQQLRQTLGEDLYARCGEELLGNLSPVDFMRAHQQDSAVADIVPLTFDVLAAAYIWLLTQSQLSGFQDADLLEYVKRALTNQSSPFCQNLASLSDPLRAIDYYTLCTTQNVTLVEKKEAFDRLFQNEETKKYLTPELLQRLDPVLILWMDVTTETQPATSSVVAAKQAPVALFARFAGDKRSLDSHDKNALTLSKLIKDGDHYEAMMRADYYVKVLNEAYQRVSEALKANRFSAMRLWRMRKDAVDYSNDYKKKLGDVTYGAYMQGLFEKLPSVQFSPEDLYKVWGDLTHASGKYYDDNLFSSISEKLVAAITKFDTEQRQQIFHSMLMSPKITIESRTLFAKSLPEDQQWEILKQLNGSHAQTYKEKLSAEAYEKLRTDLARHLVDPVVTYLKQKLKLIADKNDENYRSGVWSRFFSCGRTGSSFTSGEKASAAAFLIEMIKNGKAGESEGKFAVPESLRGEQTLTERDKSQLMKALRQGDLGKMAAPYLDRLFPRTEKSVEYRADMYITAGPGIS